jgi:hypothetical protein
MLPRACAHAAALVLSKSLPKMNAIDALIAAAEVIITGSTKSRKR